MAHFGVLSTHRRFKHILALFEGFFINAKVLGLLNPRLIVGWREDVDDLCQRAGFDPMDVAKCRGEARGLPLLQHRFASTLQQQALVLSLFVEESKIFSD